MSNDDNRTSSESRLPRRTLLLRGSVLAGAIVLGSRAAAALASPATGTSEGGWQWCRNCMGLFFLGWGNNGECPAGGGHDSTGSGNYYPLRDYYDRPYPDIQLDWRRCVNCMGMFFVGSGNNGVCPSGGGHDSTGSPNYNMFLRRPFVDHFQDKWNWCKNCMGIFYLGSRNNGLCPLRGGHDSTGSGNYSLQVYAN